MNRTPRNFMRAMAAGRVLARLLATLAFVHAGAVVAQTITTIAGRGVQDGGPAGSAPVSYPQGVAFDSAGNLYIADHFHHRIRKVAAGTGTISTVAGDGTNVHSGDGGAAAGAGVGYPQGITVDPAGNIYFTALNRVRKIDAATGIITTIAGTALPGSLGDGGLATSATLSDPRGLAFDSSGNLYISDSGNHRIRKLAAGTGVITTVAGNGTAGFAGDGGAATSASLRAPSGIAYDPAGFLVFADSGNDRVRRIDLGTGFITTRAGGGASLADDVPATSALIANPQGIAFDSVGKILYVSDGNSRIRDIDLLTGKIYTAAGSGVSGYSGDGGPATSATINYLAPGMALDASGNLHFSDALNHRVRKVVISSGIISTVAGTGVVNGVAATSADLYLPRGMAFDGSGNLHFADHYSRRIRKLTSATGNLATLAGQDGFGATVEGGVATSATVWYPFGVAIDTNGNAYFTEYFKSKSSRVRTVAPGGSVTTLAGGNADGFGGDGGAPASALLNNPKAVAVDVQGNVYIADTDNHRVRKVTKSTGLITTVAGNGTSAFVGDGGPATSASLNMPGGIAVDGAGNLYIADTGNSRVRKVSVGGTITTIGGDGTCCYSGDYGPATAARLYPAAIAADSVGNVFIADFSTRVRRIDATTGLITTVAGTGTPGFSGDGGPATGAMLNAPAGVAVDSLGNLYIADNYNARIRKVTSDVTAPDTTIATKPAAVTTLSTATFTFTGTDPGGASTGFQCSLDGAAYLPCSATTSFQNLALGSHTLQVRAVDAWGNIDSSPVVYNWTVNFPPAISTTASHTLALDTTGLVYAWGNDSLGQLGQGRKINLFSPHQVPGLARITHVSLQRHALAVDAFKQVWSWGDNSCGAQLGPRESANTSRPARVIGANGVAKVAAGRCFSLVLKTDGTVWGWGVVPGHGTVTNVRQIPGLSGIVEISAGTAHALARRSDGAVFAFGENAAGQLGQGAAGVAQAVVQVPGITGATAIAAGDSTSMVVLGSGQIQAWGRLSNQAQANTPTTLVAIGGMPVAISIGGNTPHAVRADGALLQYSASTASWTTLPGYAAVAKVASSGIIATQEFVLGVTASGQLLASGTNTTGQLGQGDAVSRSSATAVPGFANTLMVATGMQVPGVLAVKADGTVWFWGADTTGQSGDGIKYQSSTPLSVPIAATIRQVATGYRFSVALDTLGNVWGWGDNNAAAFGGLVSRSSPALIDGATNVQAIAAAGDGLVVYLMVDGTVKKSGYMPVTGANLELAVVSGLSGIVAVAAGDGTLYALRSDGKIFALGENANGELGNGTTTASAIPVQVTGISGSVTRVVAGKGRAAAITDDGKVWTWGAAPLGNGTVSGSATAVAVTGITDAADVAFGDKGALVRRADGSLMAWGNLGLSDAAGQDTTKPYAVAFSGTVQAIAAGPANTVGYLVGSTGLALGFGNFGTVTGAAVGDGTYVARTRPVVILAPDGAGSVDGANWYLDLDVPAATSVPAALVPRSLATSSVFGVDTGLSMTAMVKYKNADVGKRINNYVLGLVPPAFFNLVKTAPQVSPEPKIQAKAKATGGFVLANLTPAGWTDVNGQLIAYSQGTANAAGGAVNILNGVNSTLIPGATFCIGYGESSGSMLSAQSLTEVLSIEGATATASGVPCVLTGMYVDGPASSTSGSSATFSGLVVGITPTGTVQFQDGSVNLLSPVALSASNEAVARSEISTAALSVGVHSIGATYSGDAQNTAVSASVPLRHEVVAAAPGASATTLSGPSSSAPASEVVLTATVAGSSPTGTVQFKDGATNLGDAVPLVGGSATLRIETLAEGSHSITAAYSGDGANAASTSSALAHTVYEAITTSISLASSASDAAPVGTTVTFTATVSGTNPGGNVIFRDGSTVIGTVSLQNGTASLTVSNFDAGQHVITAEYAGDGTNQPVTSSAVFQQVSVATPSVTIFQASPTAVDFGGQSMNTTAPAKTVTLANAGATAVAVSSMTASTHFAVSHNCATVAAGSSCSATVSFTPAVQGALTGTLSIATGGGTQTIALTGTGERSLTTHYYLSILRRAPDAGGKAFWDAEAARVQALGVNVNEVWFAMAGAFYGSPEYLAFNRDDDGYVTDLYGTFFNRAPDAGGFSDWKAQLAAGMPREVVLASFMFSAEFSSFTQAIFGTTSTRREVDTVVDFYRGLLGSLPDDGGFNFWLAQFRTAQCQGGTAVNTQVETISSAFANSPQYANRGRTNGQYVGDLYNAFLRRGAPGDLAGVQFWINQVASAAQTREQVRQAFVASPEFQGRVAAIIAQGCLP